MGRITVAHSHSSTVRINDIKSFIKASLVKKVKKYSDYCLACSKEAGKWLFGNRDFIVLNNAVDAKAFAKHDVNIDDLGFELKENSLKVGVVGSLNGSKNPLGTLEIFKHLKEINDNAVLIWIGDGPMRSQVENIIADYHLENDVKLLGIRNDISDVLQIMDCFLMPSLYEGLPVSLIEAQAAGLKCFVSDVITRETDITGLLDFLPLDNYKVWAEAINSADLTKVETYDNIVKAGYDIKQTVDFLQDFYLKI